MDIKKIKSVNALIYKLIGRLDTTTAPDLETELQNSLDGIEHLTFDLEDLEYISSAGLRVLLFAIRRMNAQGTLVVKNANDLVMEVFNITGFSSLIELE
ncbi:MAG: STAS domain-containing protein [Lachnospiraceae bacterium]|nr:STAS domain-containing protein [Lachnospiraceae bacterium]